MNMKWQELKSMHLFIFLLLKLLEEGVKEDVMFHGVEEEFRVPGDYPCKVSLGFKQKLFKGSFENDFKNSLLYNIYYYWAISSGAKTLKELVYGLSES